jgi:predicted permease
MDMVMGIWRDLRLAGRSLAKARAFTFVCVISLGIGMTPVIAVPFGLRVFTMPPEGVNTDTLVELVTTPQGSRRATSLWSYPDFVDLGNANVGASLIGWSPGGAEVALDPSQGGRVVEEAMFVSSNYFTVLGVVLAQGPGFPGINDTTDPVVVLSHLFWQRRLGSDPGAVGKSLRVNKVPHTVVGIAPPSFGGHIGAQTTDLFIPLERHPRVLADATIRFDRAKEWVNIHGRLSPGVDIVQARGVVAAVTAQLAKEHPATNESKSGTVEPYHPIGSLDAADLTIIRTWLQTLATLPLLVICLNITGMVQVRGAMRERELSIRQAIGASRTRLMQQLLAESVVLAALGAGLASLVLFNTPPLLAWWAGEPLPEPFANALRLDVWMIALVTGMCLATSVVFGWMPASRFSRPVIITVLKDDAGTGGMRAGRLQRVATALQVAIATPLLILSGMTLDRVRATATDYLGFDSELIYSAPLPLDTIEGATAAFRVRSARETLAQTGGVASVTVADGLPLDFRYRITRVATIPADNNAPKVVAAHVTRVGDGYLETLGIPLIRGRQFGVDDRVGAEDVAIVSKPLAERLFPDADPVGKRVTFGPGEKTERTLTIVGVTADFPTSQMSTDRAQLLLPLAQYPDVLRDSVGVNDDRGGSATLMLVTRSVPGEQPKAMTAALERVLLNLDPEFDSARIVTGVWLRKNSVNDFLNQSMVAGVIGGVLLLLAALGIYGVVGLMVATRIREIAVRVALGASRRRVMGMVLLDVVKLVLPGVGAGVVIAVAFVKLKGDDFGISLSGLEPLAYVAGSALAVFIAVVASLAPARRAASVEPMVAMRSE